MTVDVAATEDSAQPPSELLHQFLSARPSVKERMAVGKSLRDQTPRRAHAEFSREAAGTDPIAILEAQAATRLPKLVPIRYARMLASPFAFLRGSAAVMASDLAPTPTTGVNVQACGDMHLANFGVFGSAERHLIFGINDFDETLPGPWEWDLKRLVASVAVCGRFLGADKVGCENAVRASCRSYRKRMRQFAEMSHLEVWYSRIDAKGILKAFTPKARKIVEQLLNKARQRTHMQVLEKMTDLVDDQHRIREEAPLIVRETHSQSGRPIQEALDVVLQSYYASLPDDRKPLFSRYQILDVARKVVGVGSVGTRCWVMLLQGNDRDDPLFLQIKQAEASVLEKYTAKSAYSQHGQRVVVGQRMIQGAPDIFLGWGTVEGMHYYVRQLRDMKGAANLNPEQSNVENLPDYCGLCGWALALAHAKSGDPAVLAGYLGGSEAMDDAMVTFATAYADQTERDFATLQEAARNGLITVAKE